jgi:hypothetical protein
MNAPTPYQYLPLFAKISIERLDGDSVLRSGEMLDHLLNSYAKTYGCNVDDDTRKSAHHIARRRFAGSMNQAASGSNPLRTTVTNMENGAG